MLNVKILPQPNDTTCGPTCLHAIYRYYKEKISLKKVISEVPVLKDGGTLGVFLGIHALDKGYKAKLFSYNLKIFDPTWKNLSNKKLIEKLQKQRRVKKSKRLHVASDAYTKFLEKGGEITLFQDLSASMINGFLSEGTPVLSGLSATYLYQCPREISPSDTKTEYHDILGEPSGHFVVLCGYEKNKKKIVIADPYPENPVSKHNYYKVSMNHIIASIMLGIVTYDSNMLVIEPKGKKRE